MKTKIGLMLSIFGIGFFAFLNVGADVPIGYIWHQSLLEIHTSTPPALMYVQDSSGRRTGGNPSLPVNSVGRQGKVLSGLKEIPLSSVEQTNIASDDPSTNGQPQASTGWMVHLLDGGSQTYTVNLLGIVNGVSEVTITMFTAPKKPVTKAKTKIDTLVSAGTTTQIILAVDTSTRTIQTQRVVSGSTLLNDVKTSCQLNLITAIACKSLAQKATRVQNAFQRNRPGVEKSSVDSFLKTLNENNADGIINSTALTILQADADALLQTIAK